MKQNIREHFRRNEWKYTVGGLIAGLSTVIAVELYSSYQIKEATEAINRLITEDRKSLNDFKTNSELHKLEVQQAYSNRMQQWKEEDARQLEAFGKFVHGFN